MESFAPKAVLKTFLALVIAIAVFAAMVALFGVVALGIVTAIIAIGAALFFWSTFYSMLFGGPYVPTDKRNVEAMMAMAKIGPGDRVADLGSGDGRIVIAAAKAGAFAEGWEISPYLWFISKWKIRRAGLQDRAIIHLGSYWHEKFHDFNVITLFLIDTQMGNMERKLRAELQPDSRVVSYAFKFPTWPEADNNAKGMRLYRHAAQPDRRPPA